MLRGCVAHTFITFHVLHLSFCEVSSILLQHMLSCRAVVSCRQAWELHMFVLLHEPSSVLTHGLLRHCRDVCMNPAVWRLRVYVIDGLLKCARAVC